MQADIVIVGAGLAGVSAAARLASASTAQILLVERHSVGSNNPTPMTFTPVLERFNLEECVIGQYRRFTFHSPLGNRSTHGYDAPPLVALDYPRACQSLLNRASSAGNVEWLRSSAAQLVRQGQTWRIGLSDGQSVEAPLVIDASGRGLFTHRALGLPRPAQFSHCYGARLSNVKDTDPEEAIFLAPHPGFGDGGGWLYPLANGEVSFGYASLSTGPALPGRLVKENYYRALAAFEPYATWLKEACWEHPEVGSIPIFPVRRLVYDGLMIAGDAAGQATIWSCMGSEAALEAGKLAAEAGLQALKKGDFSLQGLASYQERWDHINRRIYRNNGWVAPVVWSMSAIEWNRQIPRVQTLTPHQMVERLRINWPVPTLPQVAFVRAYDLAGRMRRGMVRRLRSLRSRGKNGRSA